MRMITVVNCVLAQIVSRPWLIWHGTSGLKSHESHSHAILLVHDWWEMNAKYTRICKILTEHLFFLVIYIIIIFFIETEHEHS